MAKLTCAPGNRHHIIAVTPAQLSGQWGGLVLGIDAVGTFAGVLQDSQRAGFSGNALPFCWRWKRVNIIAIAMAAVTYYPVIASAALFGYPPDAVGHTALYIAFPFISALFRWLPPLVSQKPRFPAFAGAVLWRVGAVRGMVKCSIDLIKIMASGNLIHHFFTAKMTMTAINHSALSPVSSHRSAVLSVRFYLLA